MLEITGPHHYRVRTALPWCCIAEFCSTMSFMRLACYLHSHVITWILLNVLCGMGFAASNSSVSLFLLRLDKVSTFKSHLKTNLFSIYGDRSFLVNGPAVWNSLSVALRSLDTSLDIFKDKLKTFLFKTVYWMRICGLGEFARYKSPYYYYN